jgi:hypothetical protein
MPNGSSVRAVPAITSGDRSIDIIYGDIAAIGRSLPDLIEPLRMLGDGGNADEENQDADDVGLEPQDRIGVHGKLSTLGVLQDSPVPGRAGPRVRTQARHLSPHEEFRVSASPRLQPKSLTCL